MSKFTVVEHKIPCQYVREYPQALANKQEDTLYLAVKQYIPRNNPNPQPGDVTVIGAHANAFAKELYEPLWDDLLGRTEQQGWKIRSIWIADVAQQGASSVLNEDKLGNDPNWLDHSRDLLHLINLKRDEMPRPLIGIGHSMGGAQLVNLSLLHPRLLTTLVLLDPVIDLMPEADPKKKSQPQSYGIATLSTHRKDQWASRDAAGESFQKSTFYKAWDKRVLDKWIEHGLRLGPTATYPDLELPKVTLTTPVAHEVHTFLRPNYGGAGAKGKPVDREVYPDVNPDYPYITPFYRAESLAAGLRLPEVRPSVLYVFGETSQVGSPVTNPKKVAITGTGVGGSGGEAAGRVKGITFEGIGHLIPMEVAEKTADTIAEFVGTDMVRYQKEQKRYEDWTAKSIKEKQGLDEHWKKYIGALPARPQKNAKI